MSPAFVTHPISSAPEFGAPVEIAPGVLWLRLPLPYALDHINVYLFEEEDGWALFDTGIATDESIAHWEHVLAGPLGGRPIKRLVVSHYHPDHVGLAGWMHKRFAPAYHMTTTEYLFCQLMMRHRQAEGDVVNVPFYRACGLDDEGIEQVMRRGLGYLDRVTGLPPRYEGLVRGRTLRMGGRDWIILAGGGHSPDQAMLWCPADNLFLSADQVLTHITPNISVFAVQPNADPLTEFLDSLQQLRETVSANALVLPSHHLPFQGLPTRVDQLTAHHESRCSAIMQACAGGARSTLDILPVLFRRKMDPHQMSFAIGEALAHLNHLIHKGQLAKLTDAAGVDRYRAL